jgi:4'-phosphopantetheinyl transferase
MQRLLEARKGRIWFGHRRHTMMIAEWQHNPVQPDNFGLRQLELGQTHISAWRVSLDQPVHRVQELAHTLSPDEVKRAERYHFERDRKRFIVRRGLLRIILGHQLGIEPNRVQFQYHPGGKPSLAESSEKDRLCFNLSQSRGIGLYAACWNRELGVDIEVR